MLTWLIVAYDDDSGRVVGGDEDGGDDYDGGGGVNVKVSADGGGGVGDGGDDIGVKDNVGGDDRKGYVDCPTYQELLTQHQDSTYWCPKDAINK